MMASLLLKPAFSYLACRLMNIAVLKLIGAVDDKVTET